MKRLIPPHFSLCALLLIALVSLTGCNSGTSQNGTSSATDSGGYSDTVTAVSALELTSDQIDQGFEFLGDEDRIAYRWLSKAEFKDLSCDAEWCSFIYVISNDECLSVDVTYDAKDSAGAVLGNVEVVLYSTIDVVIGSQYSDASGNFSFQNPGTGPFYIVAYKTGSPDVAGTTVNTLLPALL